MIGRYYATLEENNNNSVTNAQNLSQNNTSNYSTINNSKRL